MLFCVHASACGQRDGKGTGTAQTVGCDIKTLLAFVLRALLNINVFVQGKCAPLLFVFNNGVKDAEC